MADDLREIADELNEIADDEPDAADGFDVESERRDERGAASEQRTEREVEEIDGFPTERET